MSSARTRHCLEEMSRTYYAHGKWSNPPDVDNRNSQIQDQMTVLNQALANSNTAVQFALTSITRTINADWFNNVAPGTPQQKAMKNLLHVGGAPDLNVYTVGYCCPSEHPGSLLISEIPAQSLDTPPSLRHTLATQLMMALSYSIPHSQEARMQVLFVNPLSCIVPSPSHWFSISESCS